MATNYLPTREAELVTWATNFNAKLSASPESAAAYGLTLEQVGAYQTLFNAFLQAYAKANDPLTRSPANIIAKNDAKRAMVENIRVLARIVQAAPGVTNQQKSGLGLTVRDEDPSPVPPPTVSPDIDIVSVTGRSVKIRLHSATSSGRGKPAGVQGATVFTHVGAQAPADTAAWGFATSTDRTYLTLDFASSATADTVWITAFWFNPRKASGPATPPISVNLPAASAGPAGEKKLKIAA